MSCKNMAHFRCLGSVLTDWNWVLDRVKRIIISRSAFCHSVQNRLPCCMLSANNAITVGRTIVLPVSVRKCKNCSAKLEEEYRLSVGDRNRTLQEWQETGEKSVMRTSRIFTTSEVLVFFGWSNEFFSALEILQTKICRENQTTHFVFSNVV